MLGEEVERLVGEVDVTSLTQLVVGQTEAQLVEEPLDQDPVGLVKFRLVEPHGRCEPPKDLLVRKGFADRIADLGLSADDGRHVAERDVVKLQEARGGEHDVGVVDGVGREAVDDNGEEVVAAQGSAESGLLGR